MVASAPKLAVGDTCELEITKRTDMSATGTGFRKIIAIEHDGRMRVQWGSATSKKFVAYDAQWNELAADGAGLTLHEYMFPMRVGDHWLSHGTQARAPTESRRGESDFEVKAEETITVPAGTFACLRVEGDLNAARTLV